MCTDHKWEHHWGKRCNPCVCVLWRWPYAAEHLNFQNELDFRQFEKLLFVKVIKQYDVKKNPNPNKFAYLIE